MCLEGIDLVATLVLSSGVVLVEVGAAAGGGAWEDRWSGPAGATPGGAGDVLLSPQLEENYELLVDRFLAIWHVGDRLAAYLYRGLR